MFLELPKHWQRYIEEKPESGMGYHEVCVTLKDTEEGPIYLCNRIVHNGTWLGLFEDEHWIEAEMIENIELI
jgi:hypothetical protein